MSILGHVFTQSTVRRLALVLAGSLVSAAAFAAPQIASRPAPPEQSQAASPTAEAFAAILADAINNALAANANMTDMVALQGALEEAIEAVFLGSNVTPEAALAGVELAHQALQSSGSLCAVPEGAAVQRCEAVALAFQLAERAAAAAQSDPTGATGAVGAPGDGSGAALAPPPSAGSGGGGGGVTHPPVTL